MKACPTNFTLLCTSGYNWGKGVGVGVCVARGVVTPGSGINNKINTLNANKKRLTFLGSKYFELFEPNQWKINK